MNEVGYLLYALALVVIAPLAVRLAYELAVWFDVTFLGGKRDEQK